MIKKRFIAVITVKNNLAVQSFGFNRYLPIGRPEYLVENFQRWGVDEILIQDIDRTHNNSGPNYSLIENIVKRDISTPIIYSGGIRNSEEGVNVIRAGADRIGLNSLIYKNFDQLRRMSSILGAQAIIACLPILIHDSKAYLYNYLSKKRLDIDRSLSLFSSEKLISEIMAIDVRGEGFRDAFDEQIIDSFSKQPIPIIVFGGLADHKNLDSILATPCVSAFAMGNSLCYTECAAQKIINSLGKVRNFLRPIRYAR